jgi:hypothetical protein
MHLLKEVNDLRHEVSVSHIDQLEGY